MSYYDGRASAFAHSSRESFGKLNEDEVQTLKINMNRYTFIEAGHTNTRQVKCFDNDTKKEVWGTYQELSKISPERIFVPN